MKSKKRWSNYLLDTTNKPNGSRLKISDLTETEAKDALCNAMDVIIKMLGKSKPCQINRRKRKLYHMTPQKLKSTVIQKIKEITPNAIVIFSHMQDNPNDPTDIAVNVFNTPINKIRLIKDIILNPDEQFSSHFTLTPMIRNINITTQFYPQYMPQI